MAERPGIAELSGFGLATVMARRGVAGEVIGAVLGIAVKEGPLRSTGPESELLGTGPGSWLARADAAPPGWAETLRAKLAGLASVADQSSAYVVHRLSGDGARALLRRGVAIDLDPLVFAADAVAVTAIARIGVVLWRPDDGADDRADDRTVFDVAVPRGYAASFRRWVDDALAAW